MFWIIFIILGIVLFAKGRTDHWGDWSAVKILGLLILIFSIIFQTAIIWDGITDYPALKKSYRAIEIYRSRVSDIKESYYKVNSKGSMIAGNIENLQQSTNLSQYISNLADKEAEYFSYLEKCKSYKETFSLNFFAGGLFISDKIYELPVK